MPTYGLFDNNSNSKRARKIIKRTLFLAGTIGALALTGGAVAPVALGAAGVYLAYKGFEMVIKGSVALQEPLLNEKPGHLAKNIHDAEQEIEIQTAKRDANMRKLEDLITPRNRTDSRENGVSPAPPPPSPVPSTRRSRSRARTL